jgi:FAD/FMN-containing dehydrogenase
MALLEDPTLTKLSTELDGRIVAPNSHGYDQARRVWNGMIERRPALVVECASEGDVIATIRYARKAGLPLAIRGGAHSVAGFSTCDGGLVLDLSPMRGIEVDPERRTALVGGGALLADLDEATAAHGLATPLGMVSMTGVGGLTLGGGLGWLLRAYGLACDNVLSARVVTVDGRVITASAQEEPELLWGLRGGGGNFGVVTQFEFRLHPVRTVVGGYAMFAFDRVMELGRFYRQWVREHPDEFTSMFMLFTAPDVEEIPVQLRAQPCVLIAGCHIGTADQADQVLKPLRALQPDLDAYASMPFVDMQKMYDTEFPAGRRAHFTGIYTGDAPDALFESLSATYAARPSAGCEIDMHHMGGAVDRVPDDASAFSGRHAGYTFNILAVWDSPGDDEAHRNWARAGVEALRPFRVAGEYVNFATDVGATGEAAYGSDRYRRLVELKRRYDPDNVLRLNHNIQP